MFKRKSLSIKFFITFICLIGLPVVTAITINYKYFSDIMENQIHASSRSVVKSNISIIDEKLRDLNEAIIAFSHAFGEKHININNGNITDETRYEINKTVLELKKLVNSNKIINNAFIYFIDTEYVISIDGLFQFDFFFDKVHAYESRDIKYWRDFFNTIHKFEFLEVSKVTDKNLDISKNLVSMATSLPIMGKTTAVLMITIDENNIIKYFDDAGITDTTKVLIMNENNGLIAQLNGGFNDDDIEGICSFVDTRESSEDKLLYENNIITHIKSAISRWRYIVIVPIEVISKKLGQIKLIATAICLFFVALGLIISVFLSKKMYKPIKKIIKEIDEYNKNDSHHIGQDRNEYNYIYSRICDIHERNEELNQFVTDNIVSFREKVLFEIINGFTEDKSYIESQLKKLKINLSYEHFIVVECRIDYTKAYLQRYTESERERLNNNLISNIEACMNRDHILYKIRDSHEMMCFCIMSNSFGLKERVIKTLRNILDDAKGNEEYIRITFGVGNVHNNYFNLKFSYREAIEAVKFRLYDKNSQVIDYSKEYQRNFTIYKYHNQGKIIKNHLLIGDYEKAISIINEVIDTNVKNQVPYRYMNSILIEIMGYSENLPQSKDFFSSFYPGRNVYDELESMCIIDEIKQYLSEFFSLLGKYICDNKKYNNDTLKSRILEIVETRYSEDL
jgi:two-component system, response regulator YesN